MHTSPGLAAVSPFTEVRSRTQCIKLLSTLHTARNASRAVECSVHIVYQFSNIQGDNKTTENSFFIKFYSQKKNFDHKYKKC